MTARHTLAALLAAGVALLAAPPAWAVPTGPHLVARDALTANSPAKSSPTTTIAPTPEAKPGASTNSGTGNDKTDPVTGDPGEHIDSFGIAPVGANNEPGMSRRPDLTYAGDPGSTIDDAVTVFNFGTETLTFQVSATDAHNAPDGSFSLLSAGMKPTDVGSWVSLTDSLVTVAPGMATTIPITIKIPQDAAPGDHTGGVLVSNKALSNDGGGGNVLLDRRTGTRLFLRVNGPITPKLSVEKLSVHYDPAANPVGGSAKVSYRIQNRGNIRLKGTAVASVGGPLGIGRKNAPALEVPELLPGEGMDVTVNMDGVPAMLVASAKVNLTPSGSDSDTAPKVSTSSTTFAPPYTLLLMLALVFFGLLARRAIRRHQTADLKPKFASS